MKHYLATTGISDIWGMNSKLLLMGPWCLTGEKNKKLLEGNNYVVMPSPWKPAIKIKEAADYCHKVYEEILPQLSEGLNSIHQVSYPVVYWRVLIGPWLLHFIEVLYDRYKRIENTLELFPDFYIHVLPLEQCKIAALNTADFLADKANEDYYNLKLFSLVAYDLCPQKIVEINFLPESKMPLLRMDRKKSYLTDIFYGCVRMVICNLMKLVDLFFKNPIVLSDMYHLTPSDIFLLKWKSEFRKVRFKNFYPTKKKTLKGSYSCKFRELLRFKKVSDRFKSFLYRVLPDAIPMCYMENYKFYKDSIENVNSAKVAGSAVGWYFNEEFKFFAAEVVSNGAKLIDFQHGGGYGMSLAVPTETISLEKDIFYTWGWNSNNRNNIEFLPNPHLSKLKNTHSIEIDWILFIGTAMPKYHYRFNTALLPDDMPKYFEGKKRFLHVLVDEIRSKTLYRPYPHEYGWEEGKFIKQIHPDVQFLLNGILVNWMKKVKLVVIDHSHTSFLEALTINVPSVFYWDHDVYLMRPEAEPYFELLRKAGILFNNPEAAAKKVNEVWHDVQGWWQQSEVQKAKDEFCHQFARTSKNWRKEWVEFLKGLSDKEIKNGKGI